MATPATETGHFAARDGIQLQYRLHPAEPSRGSLVVVHGFAEHGNRYDEVVQAVQPIGLSVLTYDARGHGRSGGRRVYVDAFQQYLDDLAAAIELARAKVPGPVFLFAHSMGGLVAMRLLLDRPRLVDGAVLSNPAFANKVHVPAWKSLLGRVASKYVPSLAIPSGLAPADMSRDPEMVRAYDQDPLRSEVATARWYTEFLGAQQAVLARPDAFRDLRLLALVGDGDRVIDPAVSLAFLQRIGSQCQVRVYPGFFHELIHEPPADRERVLADLRAWLGERLDELAPVPVATAS